MADVTELPLSAVFEVGVTEDDLLTAQGSPVLVSKVMGASERQVRAQAAAGQSRGARAPAVRIEGSGAASIGAKAVESYSRYVAALFDNFD